MIDSKKKKNTVADGVKPTVQRKRGRPTKNRSEYVIAVERKPLVQLEEGDVKRKRQRRRRNEVAMMENRGDVLAATRTCVTRGKRKETGKAEDVCFICKDGGTLVVCDRPNCPKAYHHDCINRDEHFFASGGRWTCGWHMCSFCDKAAQYMCYTCTFSSCKACIEYFIHVKGNKGFCETCMNLVKLIEKDEHDNVELGHVDFDDRSSLEYLFKDYWMDLQERLSLTSAELAQAKYPANGSCVFVGNEESEANRESLTKKGAKRCITPKKGKEVKLQSNKLSLLDNTEWASKELLDFVAHMKDGDKSSLGISDVRALLLEYIKRQNLRDPCEQGLILCDSRLKKLFGKVHVRHFDMLQLLESHFVIRKANQADNIEGKIANDKLSQLESKGNHESLAEADGIQEVITENKLIQLDSEGNRESLAQVDDIQGVVTDDKCCHFASEGNCESFSQADDMQGAGKLIQLDSVVKCEAQVDDIQGVISGSKLNLLDAEAIRENRSTNKRCKTHKKGIEGKSQSSNDQYASFDVNNINLLYLPRKLVEALAEDTTFHEKLVGSFVRRSISSSIEEPDLVQVVGIARATEPYKRGEGKTNIKLKILNLNKIETVSIDSISNQEFSEEDFMRLKKTIERGLIRRMTVGEVWEKAMALHAVKVDYLLESEKLQLSRLRDRANEKGWRKEVKEYVQRLQLLNSTEERLRRLKELPEVHADPDMNQTLQTAEEEAELDDKREEDYNGQQHDGFDWEVRKLPSQGSSRSNLKGTRSGIPEISSATSEPIRTISGECSSDTIDSASSGSPRNQGSDAHHSNLSDDDRNQVAVSGLEQGHMEKIWHYRDPSGKIQGPFSMVQLHKWSTNFFPSRLRIWRATETEEEYILMINALCGKFHKESGVKDANRLTSDNHMGGATPTSAHDAAPVPTNGQLTSQISPYASVKAIEGPDSSGASNTSEPNRQVGILDLQYKSAADLPKVAEVNCKTEPCDISASISVEIPSLLAELPTSTSNLAPKPTSSATAQHETQELAHGVDNLSSCHNSVTFSSTGNQHGIGSNPGLLPSDSVSSANRASMLIAKYGSVSNTENHGFARISEVWEVRRHMQSPGTASSSWGMGSMQIPQNSRKPPPENHNAGWGLPQGNASMNLGGESAQGGWQAPLQANTSSGCGIMPHEYADAQWDPGANACMWGSQQTPNGNRFNDHQNTGFRSGYSGRGNGGRGRGRDRGRGGSPLGSGFQGRSFDTGSRGPSTPIRKRICIYFQTGYCRHGTSCGYLHLS